MGGTPSGLRTLEGFVHTLHHSYGCVPFMSTLIAAPVFVQRQPVSDSTGRFSLSSGAYVHDLVQIVCLQRFRCCTLCTIVGLLLRYHSPQYRLLFTPSTGQVTLGYTVHSLVPEE